MRRMKSIRKTSSGKRGYQYWYFELQRSEVGPETPCSLLGLLVLLESQGLRRIIVSMGQGTFRNITIKHRGKIRVRG